MNKLLKLLVASAFVFTLAACSSNASEETQVAVDEVETAESLTVSYTTITEGFDWGPAITKVVLNLGVTVDENSLSKDTFNVSSNRFYQGFDWSTFTLEAEAQDHIEERTVTNVYVSDEKGNADATGTFVTIEMEIGPDVTAGSPLNYDFESGLNFYVETSYVISLNEDLAVGDALYTFNETSAVENSGNYNVLADEFTHNTAFSQDGIDLLYADYVPSGAKDASTPLIIWLHGAGEGGTNTYVNVLGNRVTNLITEDVQQYFGDTGAFVLAPQTPTMWMDVNGNGVYNNSVEGSMGESYYTETLFGLIDSYVAAHPEIDTNRIYIGGCSNGGYMTVHMITTYPEYFAAAYPAAEAYMVDWLTDSELDSLSNFPIWLTHALTDGTVAIAEGTTAADFVTYNLNYDENGNAILLDNFSNALFDRLVDRGNTNVYYSLFDNVVDTSGQFKDEEGNTYEYMGHWSWIYTLNNECIEEIDGTEVSLFDWMSQQSK